VPVALVDDAVKRILTKKFELGLFDDLSDSVTLKENREN